MSVVDSSLGYPLEIEEKASMLLAGGITQYGYQCGMLWGAALAAGAESYRRLGTGPQAEATAIIASQRLTESFRTRNKDIDCLEVSGVEWKATSKNRRLTQTLRFFIRGGPVGCFTMAAGYAPIALRDIKAALSEKNIEVPSPPVSCAALVAQKMGASEMHTVMAAGFAGGIGLSGGACGALGAAIWIIGMEEHKRGISIKLDLSSPGGADAIKRFLRSKSANFRFECSEIVGQKFENVEDHAAYLRDGGCSDIIEVLSAFE